MSEPRKHRFLMIFTAIASIISLLIFTISLILTLLVGSDSKAQSLAADLLGNPVVRKAAATKLIDQIASDNDAQTVAILKKKREQFIASVETGLADPTISAAVKSDIAIGYSYATGQVATAKIEVTPFTDTLINALARVDSHFKKNGKALKDVKPLILEANDKLIVVKTIRHLIGLALWISLFLVLTLCAGRFFLGYSKLRVIRTFGIQLGCIGFVPLIISIVGGSIAEQQISKSTEQLVQVAAPVAVHAIQSTFSVIATLWLSIGLALVLTTMGISLRNRKMGSAITNQ